MAQSLSRISLKGGEKISFITNLSTMLSAGIPIIDAVDSLLEDTKGGQRVIIETLKKDLMQGNRVYLSFAKFPGTFDSVTVNLIKASEEAGTLETTLKDLRGHILKEMEFTDRIKAALIYPLVILFVFVAVLILILIFVVPKISNVFKKLRVELPLPTKIMVFVSDLVVNQTWYFVGGLAAMVLFVIILFRTKRNFFINILISFPLVSQLVKEIDLTRFSRSLYLLLSAGLPITSALELSHDVVFRPHLAQLITKSREMILSGKRLSDGFRTAKGSIPSIVVKLIEAGEKSGSLDKSMQDISEFLDYQVSNTLKNLTAVIEPIMLLVVGVFVGGMMMAIIAPIYGLIGQVGGR
jgi:type II secretory pathway component PulF